MIRLTSRIAFALLVLTASLVPRASNASETSATPVLPDATPVPVTEDVLSTVPTSLQSALDFCQIQGGIIVERYPFAATNTPDPIQLEGSLWLCEFTGSPEADPPTSRISISLETLYAPGPTLATLAYLSNATVPEVEDASSLASSYCSSLGGSSRFGPDLTIGGGWASDPHDPQSTSIGICVFPDGSAIDDWGLAYHAMGVIRGADLTSILRYQQSDVPDVFEGEGD